MKKVLFTSIAVCAAMFITGCTSTKSLSAAAPEPTVADLQQEISSLKVRLAVLELDYKIRADREKEIRGRRALLASNRVERVRSKSKLVIQPKALQSMNLLGERFPVKSWQLRENNLKNLKFKGQNKAKPKLVTPLTPDSRAIPPAPKEERSINDAIKEENK